MLKTAFPFSLQEIKRDTEHVEVIISVGKRRVPFHVHLMPCPVVSNSAMMFTYLESPPATGKSPAFEKLDDSQKLWVRVLSVFEANLQNDIDQIPPSARDQLVRTWGLAYLALAYDQRGGSVKRRQVDLKMGAALRYAPIGEEKVDDPKRIPDLTPEKVQKGVEEYLAGNLAGKLLAVDGDLWARYLEFERSLLNQIFKITRECSEFKTRLEKIHNCCENIRKTAGDAERVFLQLLQSCADTALSDAYEFTSLAVLDELEKRLARGHLRDKLTHEDIVANRYLHTPREELGGLVLALHPIGSVILDSIKAVELLMAHVLNPGDPDARERFNAILVIATRIYCDLIGEQGSDKETTESYYQDSDKPDKPTPIDLARTAMPSPAVETASNEMYEWIMRVLKDEKGLQRFKPVFLDRIVQGMSVADVARKHGISVGEVSKRTNAVMKQLNKLAVKQGFISTGD